MSANRVFVSSAVPLPVDNIDTDQIIPARYLKQVTKQGFGDNLFRDWRYQSNGQPDAQFVLNNPLYQGRILVAGNNFGCGSSREHAAWALKQYGFDVVVSSEFADIFKNNALNNAVLPIEVFPDFLHTVFTAIEEEPTAQFEVNLEDQTLRIASSGETYSFTIDPFKKQCLLEGMDELDYLYSLRDKITAFESNHTIF